MSKGVSHEKDDRAFAAVRHVPLRRPGPGRLSGGPLRGPGVTPGSGYGSPSPRTGGRDQTKTRRNRPEHRRNPAKSGELGNFGEGSDAAKSPGIAANEAGPGQQIGGLGYRVERLTDELGANGGRTAESDGQSGIRNQRTDSTLGKKSVLDQGKDVEFAQVLPALEEF